LSLKRMNKYNIGFSIKLPIPGQQYSNLETRFDWSEDTELPFKEALEQSRLQIIEARKAFNTVGAEAQAEYRSLIEEQEAKLNKAREEYIKLKNEK